MMDTTAFDAAIEEIEKRIDVEISNALDNVAKRGAELIATSAQFTDHTGRLRGSFVPFAARSLGAPDGERVIGTDVPYGFFLEFGTKSAKGRAAADHVASGFHASRGVKRAAGTWRIEPRHFVSDAREAIADMLRDEVSAAMVKAYGGR